MAKVGSWNTTAANNNSTPPDGWPEGQAPSTVNDCAREMMAQIKTMVNNIEYIDLNNTPSFLTATTFSLASADTANFTVGRRVKLGDGGNTLYGTINSVSATFVSVQLDFSSNQLVLDSSLSTCSLAIIRPDNMSIPENIWKRRNVLINGNMEIWQRSATFALGAAGTTYTADRWKIGLSLSANTAVNVTRFERSANASAVPTVLQCGTYLGSSLIVSVSAISSAIGAGQFGLIEYDVEGYDFRQIAQRPMTLSFWCNTRQSGIYAVSLANNGGDQSIVQNFTVSAIATWTRFSLSFPKPPTAGTWDYSRGAGLRVRFALAAGSTFQAGAGNWTAVNAFATSSQVNFFQSAGNTFALTGVQLEEGQFSTPLEVKNYAEEKAKCERYFQAWPEDVTAGRGRVIGMAIGTARTFAAFQFPTTMRAAPTVTYPVLGAMSVTDNVGAEFSISAVGVAEVCNNNLLSNVLPVGAPLVSGSPSGFIVAGGGISKIFLDSEL